MKRFATFANICLGLLSLCSCSSYFNVRVLNQDPRGMDTLVERLSRDSRVFILRNGTQVRLMENARLTEDRESVQAFIAPLPLEHSVYLLSGYTGKWDFNPKTQKSVLREAHLYTTEELPITDGPYSLPLNQIKKIEIIEPDKKKTTQNHLVAGIGIGVVALVVLLIIGASSFGSFGF